MNPVCPVDENSHAHFPLVVRHRQARVFSAISVACALPCCLQPVKVRNRVFHPERKTVFDRRSEFPGGNHEGVLFCGGLGTRLREYTGEIPKPW